MIEDTDGLRLKVWDVVNTLHKRYYWLCDEYFGRADAIRLFHERKRELIAYFVQGDTEQLLDEIESLRYDIRILTLRIQLHNQELAALGQIED